MDYKRFYAELFRPIEERIGPIDECTIFAIMGFDFGGPVNLCTVGHGRERFVTYVSCELAVRDGQQAADAGPYEVMMACDDEDWARTILTKLGQVSFESRLGHGHTVDIGEVVGAEFPIQGLVVEEFARVWIDGGTYGILRFHGVTRQELECAIETGSNALLDGLKRAGIYPNTSVDRTLSITIRS